LLKIIKLSEAFLAKSTLIKTFTLSSFMEWMVRKLFDFIDIISHWGEAPMAHACNPNYSGDRDQEDLCSKPDSQTLHDTLCRKKFTKMGWWSGTRCRHWVQTVVLQKNPHHLCYQLVGSLSSFLCTSNFIYIKDCQWHVFIKVLLTHGITSSYCLKCLSEQYLYQELYISVIWIQTHCHLGSMITQPCVFISQPVLKTYNAQRMRECLGLKLSSKTHLLCGLFLWQER
jgi:hypothetical protein